MSRDTISPISVLDISAFFETKLFFRLDVNVNQDLYYTQLAILPWWFFAVKAWCINVELCEITQHIEQIVYLCGLREGLEQVVPTNVASPASVAEERRPTLEWIGGQVP